MRPTPEITSSSRYNTKYNCYSIIISVLILWWICVITRSPFSTTTDLIPAHMNIYLKSHYCTQVHCNARLKEVRHHKATLFTLSEGPAPVFTFSVHCCREWVILKSRCITGRMLVLPHGNHTQTAQMDFIMQEMNAVMEGTGMDHYGHVCDQCCMVFEEDGSETEWIVFAHPYIITIF